MTIENHGEYEPISASLELASHPPAQFNIADYICDRHSKEQPDAVVVVERKSASQIVRYTYRQLYDLSTEIAGGLVELGVSKGDRVACGLTQGFDLLATHIAVLRLGAISIPIASTFIGNTLAQLLNSCDAKVFVCNSSSLARFNELKDPKPKCQIAGVDVVDGGNNVVPSLRKLGSPIYETVQMDGASAAFIFFTSGSSGSPKGVTHGHRVLFALLPGFQLRYNLAPLNEDLFWTPSGWSWFGAFAETVLPAMYFGQPLVTSSGHFDVEIARSIISKLGVTCAYLAPVVLRRMYVSMTELPQSEHRLRAIQTGGEKLSWELRAFVNKTLGVPLNDAYGLTEATDLAVGCEALYRTPDTAVGRAVPGREIAILDPQGHPVPYGELGEIAVGSDDAMVMLGYWPTALSVESENQAKWLHTGDLGRMDAHGFLFFEKRIDNLLKIRGMQVNPEEIELALATHAAVAACGVTAAISETDNYIVAFMQLRSGYTRTNNLEEELRDLVRDKVARFASPRIFRFVTELPLSATGKVQRKKLLELAPDLIPIGSN